MIKKELKLNLKFKSENFNEFIKCLDVVSSIDDTVKIKIDGNNILIYSMINGGSIILAFKNFLLPTKDYIISDIDYNIDIIIPNCKKFVKNLAFIRDLDKLSFDINCREIDNIMVTRAFKISSGKFKVNWLGGESSCIRDVNLNMLNKMLNIDNRNWKFNISIDDFMDIKKLSNINSERIINIEVKDSKISLSERSAWEIDLGEVNDISNATLIFNKRFFSCINDKVEAVEFNIFDNFMLIKDNNSNLMLSFEQSFDQNDDY